MIVAAPAVRRGGSLTRVREYATDSGFGDQGYTAFAESLKTNTRLSKLSFSGARRVRGAGSRWGRLGWGV
jgi:hypothetical protein